MAQTPVFLIVPDPPGGNLATRTHHCPTGTPVHLVPESSFQDALKATSRTLLDPIVLPIPATGIPQPLGSRQSSTPTRKT